MPTLYMSISFYFSILPCSGFSDWFRVLHFILAKLQNLWWAIGGPWPTQGFVCTFTCIFTSQSQHASILTPEQLLLVTELSPYLSELNHVFSFSPPENWFIPESLQGNCFIAYYCSPKHALLKLRWCQSRVVCPSCTSGWQNDPLCCRSEQR